MTETVLTIAGALVSAGGLVLVGWFTYRSTRKRDKVTEIVSREANAITFSQNLMARIETLEARDEARNARVAALEEKDEQRDRELSEVKTALRKLGKVFGVAVNYIERFLQWAKDGSRPPIPDIPDDLREHLDPSLITEHHRQQQEHNPTV